MWIVSPSVRFEAPFDGREALERIERAARTSYLSELAGNTEQFVKDRIRQGHLSVLEHAFASVRIVTDRGVSHEIVRHRLCAITQESTRYCCYAEGRFGRSITVVRPTWAKDETTPAYRAWLEAMQRAEDAYFQLLGAGLKAQEARAVLPNSLKTELVLTANLREWRHILELRTSKAAHPDMRRIMIEVLWEFNRTCPAVFEDLLVKIHA